MTEIPEKIEIGAFKRSIPLRQMANPDGARAQGETHSRRVTLLKVSLPVLAVALVTIVLTWPQISPEEHHFRLVKSHISAKDAEALRMRNARFVGVDAASRPFLLTATEALQQNAATPLVDLTEPRGDLTEKTGRWTTSNARHGLYNREIKTLALNGEVSIYRDTGDEFHTSSALINFNDSSAAGDAPVEGQGPTGNIVAEGFRLYDSGDRILFTGKARLVLQTRRKHS